MKDKEEYRYHRSHRKDDRVKVAEAYRIEAERAEAEKLLKQAFKDPDDMLDPITDYSDGTDPR